jgi:RHS repeat-associated protein
VVTGKTYDETMEAVAVGLGSIAPPMTEHFLSFAKQFFTDIKTVLTETFFKRDLSSGVRTETDVIKEQISSLITKEEVVTEEVTTTETKAITVAYYEPTRYVYDVTQANPEVLLEKTSATGSISAYYEYGAGGRYSKNGEQIYVYDGRGSVSEVTEKEQIVAQYRYDPYGNLSQGTVGQDRAYTYNAQQYIPQTGLQYLRARHYDASTGNFTSKDTYLGSQTNLVTQNRYTYANNNPISYQDPSGHAGILSKVKGAASGVSTTKVKSYTSVGSSSIQVKTSTTKFVSAVVNPNPEVPGRTKAVLSKTIPAKSQNTVAKSTTSVAAQMVSKVISSVAPPLVTTNGVTSTAAYAASSTAAYTASSTMAYAASSTMAYTASSTEAYAASSATAVSYQTMAAITSPTVSRYNRSKAPVRGVKQTSSFLAEKPISLNGGELVVSQMQQSLGNFWQTSYHQWTPQSNQVLDEQSMLSLIYQNSLKSNTAKKDSAIGAAEAAAKTSVQKDKVTFGLKVQSLSVEKFEEKNNKQNSDVEQYLLDSAEQFSYGNYTDKQTVLGSLGSIGLGLIGLDAPGDLRDISADLVNWQWTWGNAGQLALDTVSIVPLVGIIKYTDEGTCILKALQKGTDDMASSIKSFFKTTDKVDEAVDVINKGGSETIETAAQKLPMKLDLQFFAGKGAVETGSNKAVVLGEGMGALKTVAKQLQSEGIDAKWYQAWSNNFAAGRRMTEEELASALSRNQRWIESKIKQGYDIYDIGIDPQRITRSPFYELEQQMLKKYDYPTIDIRSMRQ